MALVTAKEHPPLVAQANLERVKGGAVANVRKRIPAVAANATHQMTLWCLASLGSARLGATLCVQPELSGHRTHVPPSTLAVDPAGAVLELWHEAMREDE